MHPLRVGLLVASLLSGFLIIQASDVQEISWWPKSHDSLLDGNEINQDEKTLEGKYQKFSLHRIKVDQLDWGSLTAE